MKDQIRTYILSKEYALILFPLFLILITWVSLPPFYRYSTYILPIICLWSWWRFFFTDYKVSIIGDKEIIFKSIVKTTKLNAEDILWIKESIGFLQIKHSNGKNYVSTMINNISDLKSNLKAINPGIETKLAYYRGGAWK